MNSGYEVIAREYYEERLHPTCANFDQLSRRYFEPRLRAIVKEGMRIGDFGAGRSMVSRIIGLRPSVDLFLVDSSSGMLSHSDQYVSQNTRPILANVESTEFAESSFDIVVASLGDPFNTPMFWEEIRRILKQGGICLFTSPAVEWAETFRRPGTNREAEFALRDGTIVFVPSIVLSPNAQSSLVTAAGLNVRETQDYRVADLVGPISSKLSLTTEGDALVVLRGFAVHKD